jgi:Holliday junction resolvasome RuvABC DNA-binding subunit
MELLDITGVGPVTAGLLTDAGFTTVASVAGADTEALAGIRGIGPVGAESMKAEASRLVAAAETGPTADPGTGASNREQQAKKLRKHAKKLRKRAGQQARKAKSTTSKKKRKHLANKAAKLEKAAAKARREAKKLLAG